MTLHRIDVGIKGHVSGPTILVKVGYLRQLQSEPNLSRNFTQQGSWLPDMNALTEDVNLLIKHHEGLREALKHSTGDAVYATKSTLYGLGDKFGAWGRSVAHVDLYAHMDEQYYTFWKIKFDGLAFLAGGDSKQELSMIMSSRRTGKSYVMQQMAAMARAQGLNVLTV